MADPTAPSATAAAVQVMIDTAAEHRLPYTLPVPAEHCTCGELLAGPDYRASAGRHAAEQVLLALGALREVPLPSADELLVGQIARLLAGPVDEDEDILPPEEVAAGIHALYVPVLDGLAEQIHLFTLSFDALVGFYEDALAERNAARRRADLAEERTGLAEGLLKHRNREYGRASAEIGVQRGQLARAYEHRRIAIGQAELARGEIVTARTLVRVALGLDGQGDFGALTLAELLGRLVAKLDQAERRPEPVRMPEFIPRAVQPPVLGPPTRHEAAIQTAIDRGHGGTVTDEEMAGPAPAAGGADCGHPHCLRCRYYRCEGGCGNCVESSVEHAAAAPFPTAERDVAGGDRRA